MSRPREEAQRGDRRFPRVSGDEPAIVRPGPDVPVFSPRERG